MLEAAQTRYERAEHAFRAHHLPDLAGTAKQQLRVISGAGSLARKYAEMQRGYGRLEQMRERLQGAGPLERERIMRELHDLSRLPGQGDLPGALNEALDAIRELYDQHPERVRSGDAAKVDSLQDQIGSLASMLEHAAPEQEPATGEGPEQEIMRALTERLKGEVESGRVSADRAAELGDILEQLGAVIGKGVTISIRCLQARKG